MNRVDPALTEWQKLLIDKYLDIPWSDTLYDARSTSDHYSWYYAGYPVTHSLEGAWEHINMNNIHSPTDTLDVSSEFSFAHILQFTKLAVAFAVELSDY